MAINTEALVRLPLSRKLIILAGILTLIGVVFYFNFYAPKMRELRDLEARLEDAKRRLEESRKVTVQLARFKKEVALLNESLKEVLKKLPNEKEIPGLLTSISTAGKESGLEFLLFKPGPEVKKGFYAEVPVNIEALGSYHSLAIFFDRITRLPRIVNVKGLKIGGPKEKDGQILLKASFLVTTYRFLPQEEKGEKKGRKKR